MEIIHTPTHSVEPSQLSIPHQVIALAAPDNSAHPLALTSLAGRVERGELVGVLIGHNRFDLYSLMQWARQRKLNPQRLLAHVELSRAFTCHQLHRRLMTLDPGRRWRALYVLGLLDTFYDESVSYHEAARLLNDCIVELKRIARAGLPVLITLSVPKEPGREDLIGLVAHGVDEYWALSGYANQLPTPPQMPLLPA
jgi:hypothetical protein